MGRRRVVKACTENIDVGKQRTGAQILGLETSPELIPKLAFETIIEKVMCTPPVDRNIFVSMNVFNLHEINPTLKFVPNSPTSIIIFCIRMLRSDKFQPIGALQTYDDTDQSVTIAQCLRVFISDLAILGLNIVATVSPPNTVFKAVLQHLVQTTSDKTASDGAITYSAGPYKEIIHLYDINVLIAQFENLFEQRKEVRYTFNNSEEMASWTDIYLIHTAINSRYGSVKEIPDNYKSDISIFSPEFQIHFNKCRCLGILTPANESTQTLLLLMHSFASLLDSYELEVEDLRYNCHHWEKLKLTLSSLCFKKVNPHNVNRTIDLEIDTEFKEEVNFEIEAARIASIMDFLYHDSERERVHRNGKSKPVIIRNNQLNDIDDIDSNKQLNGFKKTDNNKEVTDNINNNTTEENKSTKPTVVSELRKQNTTEEESCDKDNTINNYLVNRPKSTRANIVLDYLNSIDYKTNPKTDSDNINDGPKKSTKTFKYFNKQNKTVKEKVQPLVTDCDITQKIIETENNNIGLYLSGSPVNLTDVPVNSEFDFEVEDMDEFIEKHFVQAKTEVGVDALRTLLKNKKFKPESPKCICDITPKDKVTNNSNTSTDITKKLGSEGNYLKFKPVSELKETKHDDMMTPDSSTDCDTSNVPKSKSDDRKSSLFNVSPDSFEKKQLTADWLSTIHGIRKLSEKLIDRKVKKISPHILTAEHADYFVTLIKKAKNMLKCVTYVGRIYSFLDYESAFRTLESEVGLYLIRK